MIEVYNEGHTPKGTAVTALILHTFRANGRLLRAGDLLCRDLEVTSARWQALGAILDTPKTVAQIAREFELTRQGVLPVVRSMAKDGLVKLVANPNHRRAKLVQITDRGRVIYKELLRRQASWANDLGKSFTVAELQQAADVLSRLGDAVRSHPLTAEAERNRRTGS